MSTPETLKSTTSESLATKPSDTLLKNFKEKLEVRWSEFDAATMKEAQSQVANHPLWGLTNAKKERDKDANFIKAKAAFDQARTALNAVTDDAGLKQILNSPGNLLSAIQTLEAHFAVVTAPEKAKEYNHVLANTLADLTSLKSQVTDTAEDKKAAEVAAATVKTMPAIAAGSVGAAALATGSTLDLEKVADWAQKQIQEATSGFSRWAQEKAKEKWFMGDIFRNLEKKAGEWIKELSAPPTEWWIDAPKENFMYMIKKWFAPMIAGWFGIKTSNNESEKSKTVPENKPNVTKEVEVKSKLADESYRLTSAYLLQWQDSVQYSNWLSAAVSGMTDATIWKTEQEKKDAVKKLSVNVLTMPVIRDKTYSQIIAMGEEWIKSQIKWEKVELAAGAAKLIYQMLKNNESFFDKVFSASMPNWKDKSIEYIVAELYAKHGYSSMVNVANAMKDQKFLKIENIAQLPSNFFGYVDMTMNPPKFSWILGDRFDELQKEWLTVGLAKDILIESNVWDSKLANTASIINGKYSDWEKGLLKKITSPEAFLNPFKISLAQKFGFSPELMNTLSVDGLSLKDTFELFAIMRGSTDVSTLKEWDKWLLLLKLQFLFAKNNMNAYSAFMLEAAKSPDQYKEVLAVLQTVNTAVNKSVYIASQTFTEWVKWLWNAITGGIGIDTVWGKIAAAVGVSAVGLSVIVGAFMIFPPGVALLALTALFGLVGWGLLALAQKFIGTK
jgi:hypothetical protein